MSLLNQMMFFSNSISGPNSNGGGGTLPAYTAHRYWRIVIRRKQGGASGSFVGLSQITMRDEPAGAQLLTAGMLSSNTALQAGALSQLVDGSPADSLAQWNGDGAGITIDVDFGAANEKRVEEVEIYPNKDDVSRSPSCFEVQYSDDDITYTTLAFSSGEDFVNASTARNYVIPQTGMVSSQYWCATKEPNSVTGTGVLGLAEMEFRATLGGADQATGGTASAWSEFGGFPASNAFDDNTGTEYSAANTVGAEEAYLIAYDFGTTVEVAQVEFTARSSPSSQAPQSGYIGFSDNGDMYRVAWKFSGLSYPLANDTQTTDNPYTF